MIKRVLYPEQKWAYFETRPNNKMFCRVCHTYMRMGDPCVLLDGANAHRICLKRLIEWTLDVLPLTWSEIEQDPTGRALEVETARLQREFDEYREKLLRRGH